MFRGTANGTCNRRVNRIAIGNRKQCENSRIIAFQRTIVQAFGEESVCTQHGALAFEAHTGTQPAEACLVLPAFLKVGDFLLHARIP
jgi:hypothetical protein